MDTLLEIKPQIGFSSLLFGATMVDAQKIWGEPEDIQLIDEIDEFKATVWHYWDSEFTLFFDEQHNQLFNCVEISNKDTVLWGQKIFSFKEKQIIELFKSTGIVDYETEQHEWGERRLGFDTANIDFYFEKNKLISVNFCKALHQSTSLILKN
jgi:hypothetical protein